MARVFARSLAIVATTAGAIALAGCGKPATTASVANSADEVANAIEARADNLEALAGSTANDATAAMLAGADTNLADDAAGNDGALPASTADH